eukprot:gene11558-biopygen1443
MDWNPTLRVPSIEQRTAQTDITHSTALRCAVLHRAPVCHTVSLSWYCVLCFDALLRAVLYCCVLCHATLCYVIL